MNSKIKKHGTKCWYTNGNKEYCWVNGVLWDHLPTPEEMKNEPRIDKYGTKRWYKNGNLHREDGPAVEYVNGDKSWYQNGLLHRENGPAIDGFNGKEWFQNGKHHREDGPAVEYADGDKEYWINGIQWDHLPTPEEIITRDLIE